VPPAPTKPDPAATFPAFNAVQAMSEGVFSEEEMPSAAAKTNNPLISADKGENRPHLPPAPPTDSSPRPSTDVVMPDLANKGRTIWHDAKDDETRHLADWVSAAYGWTGAPTVDTQRKALDDTNPAWGAYETVDVLQGDSILSGNRPAALLGEFDQYYMSYPWITQVAAH